MTTVIDLPILASGDNVRHREGHSFDATPPSQLTVGQQGGFGAWDVGLRFDNIPLDDRFVIERAWLRITPQQDAGGEFDEIGTILYLQDVDNSGQITNDELWHEYLAVRSEEQVIWDLALFWTLDVEERSTDISSLLQAIIDRPGWVSGNALTIFWMDNITPTNSTKLGWSFDGSGQAPILHVEYGAPKRFPKVINDMPWGL